MYFVESARTPFAQCSDYGILGLEDNFLALTDDDISLVKAEITMLLVIIQIHLLMVLNLSEFSFGCNNSNLVYSGHLEQLAIACPNIQHLDLEAHS